MLSSTKKCPCGVGVEGLPTTAAKDRTSRPRRYTSTRRLEVLTTRCQLVFVSTVPRCAIQPVLPASLVVGDQHGIPRPFKHRAQARDRLRANFAVQKSLRIGPCAAWVRRSHFCS